MSSAELHALAWGLLKQSQRQEEGLSVQQDWLLSCVLRVLAYRIQQAGWLRWKCSCAVCFEAWGDPF